MSDPTKEIQAHAHALVMIGYREAIDESLRALEKIYAAALEVPDTGRQQRIRDAIRREGLRLISIAEGTLGKNQPYRPRLPLFLRDLTEDGHPCQGSQSKGENARHVDQATKTTETGG